MTTAGGQLNQHPLYMYRHFTVCTAQGTLRASIRKNSYVKETVLVCIFVCDVCIQWALRNSGFIESNLGVRKRINNT